MIDTGGVTRARALRDAASRLAASGIARPTFEARLLLAHVLGLAQAALLAHPDTLLDPDELARFDAILQRRLLHEPIARILGEKEFWGLPFRLSAETLIPRPDTETLIEAVLDLYPDRQTPLRILDLGTGSGCILLSLLHEYPQAFGVGVDRSLDALQTARENARALGLADRAGFVAGDWANALAAPFDLIVSNPPYIPKGDIAELDPEVRNYDPLHALDGGEDGLDPYPVIFAQAFALLKQGGYVLAEFGVGQGGAVQALCAQAGFEDVQCKTDLGRLNRIVVGIKRR